MTRGRNPNVPFAFLVTLWALALALAAPPARAQAPSDDVVVRVGVERSRMYVGESQRLTIDVEGSKSVEQPDVSAITDFNIVYRGPFDSSSRMTSIINGRMTVTDSIHYALQYEITPKRPGMLTIPAITVRVAGKTYTTDPIAIEIVEPSNAADAKLDLRLDAGAAYVGQPLRMTVTWTFAGSVKGLSFNMPPVEGCETMPGPDPRPAGTRQDDPRFVTLQIEGEQIVGTIGSALINDKPGRTLSFERLLIPRKPGTLTIGPARIDYNAVVGERPRAWMDAPWDDRSLTDRRVSRANTVSIPVKPLPETGRPADFSGLVGAYGISASTTAKEISVGEPIPLQVSITGPAPLSLVPPLNLSRQGHFEPSKFRIPRTPVLGDVRAGAVVFQPSLRARSEQATELPPIELSFFDPVRGAYTVAATKSIPLTVHPSINVALPDAPDEPEAASASEARPGGLAPLDRTPLQAASWLDFPRSLTEPLVLGVFALPPLIYLLLAAAASFARLSHRDPAERRRRSALRACLMRLTKATAPAGVAQALCVFVADWFDRPPGSLTTAEAVLLLRPTAQGEVSAVARVLGSCDDARFAGGNTAASFHMKDLVAAARRAAISMDQALRDAHSSSPRSLLAEARPIVRGIVTMLALAAALGLASTRAVAALKTPTDAWGEAQQAYDDAAATLAGAPTAKPSTPVSALFVAAADRFEGIGTDESLSSRSRARAWFNAGNAALLAGESPRAVLDYRRAGALNPSLDGLAGNLAIARQKTGVAPPETEPGFGAEGRALAEHTVAAMLPRGGWFLASAGAFAGVWGLAAVSLFRRQTPMWLKPTGAILLVMSLLTGRMLLVRMNALENSDGAVVLGTVAGRSGPDELVFQTTSELKPGMEVRIVERRTLSNGLTWYKVRPPGLAKPGGEPWVPAASIALVSSVGN